MRTVQWVRQAPSQRAEARRSGWQGRRLARRRHPGARRFPPPRDSTPMHDLRILSYLALGDSVSSLRRRGGWV